MTGKVVIVEDSATVRQFLVELVEEAGFEVVGVADNGIQGEAIIREKKPGLVLSDIRMPGGDGIDMTSRLMRTNPVPVVLITAFDPTNPDLVFRAMQAGALDVLPKPPARTHASFDRYRQQFNRTLKILHGVPVVRRFQGPERMAPAAAPERVTPVPGELPILAIGASTGGPTLVASLIQQLRPGSFFFAVIAQHIVADFLPSFRDWLQSLTPNPVRLAEEGEDAQEGTIYLAPPGWHLICDISLRWRLLSTQAVGHPHVPSIDLLFESLAPLRQKKVGILLTGMGQDGAAGLKLLKETGAFTIVQDPSTAVIMSMPQSAINLNAESKVMTPEEIQAWIQSMHSL